MNYNIYKIKSIGTGQEIETEEIDPETGENIKQIDPIRPSVSIPGGWKTGGKCPHNQNYIILCQCNLTESENVQMLNKEEFISIAEEYGFSSETISDWCEKIG